MILIIQIWTNLTFSNLNVNFCSNYRYDTRGEDKSYEEARHWSDDKVLTGRAFFRGDHDPGRLILDNVGAKDQGVYKCRVDFRKAPTRISNVNLNVIGEKTWRKQLENLRKTFFFLPSVWLLIKLCGQTICEYVNLNVIGETEKKLEENFVLASLPQWGHNNGIKTYENFCIPGISRDFSFFRIFWRIKIDLEKEF